MAYGNGNANGSDSLAAHTPTSDYIAASAKRRVLQLLGANEGFISTVAPLPYKSEYPFSPKVIDALLTVGLDPYIKPLSLKPGALDRLPVLKKLGKELANRGFFRKYPGGGIGVGGGAGGTGGDSGDSGGTGAGGSDAVSPADAIGGNPEGNPATAPTAGDPGTFGPEGNPTANAANAAAVGALTADAVGTALGLIGSVLGIANPVAGLGVTALGKAVGPLSHVNPPTGDQSAPPAQGPGESPGDQPPGMTPIAPSPSGTPPGENKPVPLPLLPNKRSQPQGRQGISPQFLEILERLR